MAFVRVGGGIWVPSYAAPTAQTNPNTLYSPSDAAVVDADEEEIQLIGYVYLAAGTGTKTFGTSSKISWLPGGSVTFADDGASDPTLRVGIKKASVIDAANGPAARATIGAAAFNVYDDLVGGTDTITSTTYRTDNMSANDGANVSVTHGDLIAVCFHLDKPGAAAQSVKVRTNGTLSGGDSKFPATTLVTSGPTYTNLGLPPNVVLTFDDGSLGWLEGSAMVSGSAVGTEAIGNTNIYGNIWTPTFKCKVDAMAYTMTTAGTTNYDAGLWSDPLGTPAAVAGANVSVDPQILTSTGQRAALVLFPTETELTVGSPYAFGVQQNSATALTIVHSDFAAAGHMQANGLDSTCYAAKSTAGAAFAAQNSGLRRGAFWLRISSVDDGAGGGAGGNANILYGSVIQ